jgi:hypothetical protein
MTTPVLPPPEAPWRAGLRSARANFIPGLFLQIFAVSLVVTYFQVPAVQEALVGLTDLRAHLGFSYSFLSTALFGGLLPLLYLWTIPATRLRFSLLQGVVLVGFWGLRGIEVDLFYRILAATVGEGREIGTVVNKVLLDQFVYCPLLAMPITWIGYRWIEYGFRWSAVWPQVRRRDWFMQDLLPLMIANFGVWLPAVVLIYLLPTPLQLPMQNLVLCFFTLMVAHLSKKRAEG